MWRERVESCLVKRRRRRRCQGAKRERGVVEEWGENGGWGGGACHSGIHTDGSTTHVCGCTSKVALLSSVYLFGTRVPALACRHGGRGGKWRDGAAAESASSVPRLMSRSRHLQPSPAPNPPASASRRLRVPGGLELAHVAAGGSFLWRRWGRRGDIDLIGCARQPIEVSGFSRFRLLCPSIYQHILGEEEWNS